MTMPIHLRTKLVNSLIEARFGDIAGFITEWEERAESKIEFPHARQQSSVYRWLKDGLPSRGEEVFAFCALLDADPLALFDYHRNGYFSNFARLRRNLQMGLAAAGVFSPLYKMYRPGPHWPANDIARRCYDRDWFGVEFNNEENWKTTDYGRVDISFRAMTNNQPRTVHIAYRRRNSPDTMWRFYGSVIGVEDQIELYSEGGAFLTMPRTDPEVISFRTYYGGRPVEWRVASLHEFDLVTKFPFNDDTVIGFEW